MKEPDKKTDQLAHEVIGAAIEVHRILGPGFLESVYEEALIVELKTVENLAPIHVAQTLSYLKATGYALALLINFNVPVLEDGIKRVVLT
ncbi:MAG TPA: hypothetical protein DEP53_05840 [Bacteroidetes bacterium]|nr:hypothetical protein [Bacteroidota bacterium]